MPSPFALDREADKLRKRYDSLERRAVTLNEGPDSASWQAAFAAEAKLHAFLDENEMAGAAQDNRTPENPSE